MYLCFYRADFYYFNLWHLTKPYLIISKPCVLNVFYGPSVQKSYFVDQVS